MRRAAHAARAAVAFCGISARGVHGLQPIVTLVGDVSVVLELGATWLDPGADCVDPEDGPISVSLPSLGSTAVEGSHYPEYSCTDSGGETARLLRHVVVRDTTPPVLTLAGAASLDVAEGAAWPDPGASCQDLERAVGHRSLPVAVNTYFGSDVHHTPGNVVDTDRTGTFTMRYTCADLAGNTATAVRSVTVVDSTPPALSLRGPSMVNLRVGDAWHDPGGDCMDAVDGRLPVSIAGDAIPARPMGVAIYKTTYGCQDTAGNVAVGLSRTVQVAAAARFWRLEPIGAVSGDWQLRGVTLFSDMDCSQALPVLPRRSGRRWPNGVAFSTPAGSSARADAAFASWTPRGPEPAGLSPWWHAGQRCDASSGLECHVGFAFEEPTVVNCVTLEQGTAAGSYALGLRLQWREAETGPFREFARILRSLSGGPVQLQRQCPAACSGCGSQALTVHPCAAY